LYQTELNLLTETTQAIKQTITKIIQDGFTTEHKDNYDPVTIADFEVDSLLKETLLSSFPDDGWLSEETRDNPKRLPKKRVWIVDPIDGTKEFVQQIPEYSVSVALVDDGQPVVGMVYNPSRDEIFTAIKGQGAWLNGEPIKVIPELNGQPSILASRSEIKRGEFESFEPLSEVIPTGSIAYKLALVAAGRADSTFSLGPKNEWDIAAGVLLVQEAGGYVSDKFDRSFTFNQANTLVDSIVATSAASKEVIYSLIKSELS
jgi:myo-inositol-1(or 4)-monophosphatase